MTDTRAIQSVLDRFLRDELPQERATDTIVRLLVSGEATGVPPRTHETPDFEWLDMPIRDDARAQALLDAVVAQLREYSEHERIKQPEDKAAKTADLVAKSRNFWRSAGRKQLAHYHAAEVYARRHRRIGIPSVMLSTIVATSIFSTLSENVNVRVRIATGTVALLAAIGAALQAWLAYGERAEKHRVAGARYGKVRNDLELFELKFGASDALRRDDAIAALQTIGEELGSLESDSPTLSNPEYDAGKCRFDETHPVQR